MSITTATIDHHTSVTTDTAEKARAGKGFWQWLIRSREAQGRARVRQTFRNMSDMQLMDIGLTPDQIRFVRAKGTLPTEFWG
jgi:uncharacterized protein YjiS (DUF1127 family)